MTFDMAHGGLIASRCSYRPVQTFLLPSGNVCLNRDFMKLGVTSPMMQTGIIWVTKRLKILRDAAVKSRLQTMMVADDLDRSLNKQHLQRAADATPVSSGKTHRLELIRVRTPLVKTRTVTVPTNALATEPRPLPVNYRPELQRLGPSLPSQARYQFPHHLEEKRKARPHAHQHTRDDISRAYELPHRQSHVESRAPRSDDRQKTPARS